MQRRTTTPVISDKGNDQPESFLCIGCEGANQSAPDRSSMIGRVPRGTVLDAGRTFAGYINANFVFWQHLQSDLA